MKRAFFALLLCAASARAELKERIAAIVNGQPILLSDARDRALAGALENDLTTVAIH